MKRGKYQKRVPLSVKKSVTLLLALVLTLGCVIGGTIAWLTDETTPVVNTFSTSDIGVELEESENLDLKMVPGWTITKDPKAWITEGSEDAYLFVEIKESDNFDNFMTYAIADGWKLLDGTEAANINTVSEDTYVIYREVSTTQMGETNASAILKDNKVTVKDIVTKADLNGLVADDPDTPDVNESTYPTLTFTAYAHQLYQNNTTKFDAATAWSNLNPSQAG